LKLFWRNMSQDEPVSDDDGDMVYPGRACLGPFRLDEDEVECSNDKCPQNDGGVCIESREDCNRRVLEEHGVRP